MEEAEIKYRLNSIILYMHHVDRNDTTPIELKREKLKELQMEKMFLESILEHRKYKKLVKEIVITTMCIITGFTLFYLALYYGK